MVQSAKARPDLADRLKKNTDDNTDLYSLMRNRHLSSQTIAIPTLSGGASSSNASGATGFLRTQGDTMVGPIAFLPVLTVIDDNQIDIGQNSGFYSSRVIVTPETGSTDNLVTITGAAFSGQILFIQGVATDTLTLIDANSNQTDWASLAVYSLGDIVDNGGVVYSCKSAHTAGDTDDEPGVGATWETYWYQANIETIDGTDFTLADDDIILFMFDTTDNHWQQVTVGKQGGGAGGEVFTWTNDHDTNGNNLIIDTDGDSRFEFGTDDEFHVYLNSVITHKFTEGALEMSSFDGGSFPNQGARIKFLGEAANDFFNIDNFAGDARMIWADANAHFFKLFNAGAGSMDMEIAGDILPEADATRSIGTASLAFVKVHQAIAEFNNNAGTTAAIPSIGSTSSELRLNSPSGNTIRFDINNVQQASIATTGLILEAANLITFLGTNNGNISKLNTAPMTLQSEDGFTLETGIATAAANTVILRGNISASVPAQIIFQGLNFASADHGYGVIKSRILDNATGTESGGMEIEVYENGTAREYLNCDGDNQLVSIGGGGTVDTIRFDINGVTGAAFNTDGSGDERLLFSGAYIDVNAVTLANVDVVSANAGVIRIGDTTVLHALTGFIGHQTSSTAVSTMGNAANVGVMQLPYKADTTNSPSDATLDNWFGDQNGCSGIQFDSSPGTAHRLWARSNGTWVSTVLT